MSLRYLHTMVRIRSIDESLRFYCQGLGLQEVRRSENPKGRFTLLFLKAPEGTGEIELTYNWDDEIYSGGRNFGHLAFEVSDIYELCSHLAEMNIEVLRPPRDGRMAFVKSPDGISVELLQKGEALPPREPWLSRPNQGSW